MTYDPSNIFARILRDEIPCNKAHESTHTLAFHDINPQAPIHILVIPKGAYLDFAAFAANASADEIVDFHRSCAALCTEFGLTPGPGFRAITNTGPHGAQEVPHYHLHLLGGKAMGRLIAADDSTSHT